MTFKNKVVWITGASSGIGRELALEFSRQGATLAVSARRMELLEQLVNDMATSGGTAAAFYCDVMHEKNIADCVDAIIAEFGQLDVVVANAGFGVIGKIEELREAEWSRQLAVNVTGLALTCKYGLPHLRKTSGRLVLLGSVAAFVSNPGVGAYGASKAAVHSIGETLQVELMNSGVSCTTIHPGFIDSNITRIDNEGNFHPDRNDPRPANMIWSTSKAAQVMVRAIERKKKVYIFTGHGKVIAFLGKYLPGIARKMMSKTQK